MSLDTTEAIMEEFRSATREHLAKHLRHDADWARFRKIESEANQRLTQEEAEWRRDYHARLAEARQIILRETHGNLLEQPKPEGIEDIPDRQALDVKADQRIRQDHQRRLAAIKQDEIDRYQALRDTLRARDRLQGFAAHAFERVRTRSGPSRD